MRKLQILALSLIVLNVASAANINWTLAPMSAGAGDTVVDNSGTSLWAYDLGGGAAADISINGVTFSKPQVTNTASQIYGDLTVSGAYLLSSDTVFYNGVTPPAGVSAALVDLFADGIYGYENTYSLNNTMTLSIANLTAGQNYKVQVFSGDLRTNFSRMLSLTGGANTSASFNEYEASGYGMTVIGSFTADASTQVITLNDLGASYPVINAISFQSITAVPEPKLNMLLGGALLVFSVIGGKKFRRRSI